MYPFVTHTWKPVKGLCPHGCAYCYMNKIYKRFGKTPAPLHLDERELSVNLGSGNTIFTGSSIDMFAGEMDMNNIHRVLKHIEKFPGNTYFFQTKCTKYMWLQIGSFLPNSILCTTLESNRHYPDIYGNAPHIRERVNYFSAIHNTKMITIEPVLDFDLPYFLRLIKDCGPIQQVNIGADSGNNHLPEPPPEKLRGLIAELEKFTKVYLKKNLGRLLK
ncbi:MAG: hypothetical protein Pg6C_18360 [Treponemataceae bacterium]|nr:MAG: hypothetical protein Pg6C_18360 [Treponemataceae bacterium]